MIYLVYYEKEEVLLNRIGPEALRQYSDLKDFLPLLQKKGTVVEVEKPEEQMDSVFRFSEYLGQPAICIFFSQPSEDYDQLQCPKYAFPASILPPVWDKYQHLAQQSPRPILTNGPVIDTNLPKLMPESVSRFMPWWRSVEACRLALKKWQPRLALYYLLRRKSIYYFPSQLMLTGVVYTALFPSELPSVQWKRLIHDFCRVFKNNDEVTLVIKMVGVVKATVIKSMSRQLKRISCSCRVIMINEHLPQLQYEHLIRSTSFIINPVSLKKTGKSILEFMSAGKPAISPKDEAADLLDSENAFIVPSKNEETRSIDKQLMQSYELYKNLPASYQLMSTAATQRMEKYCALTVVEPSVSQWLDQIEAKNKNQLQ